MIKASVSNGFINITSIGNKWFACCISNNRLLTVLHSQKCPPLNISLLNHIPYIDYVCLDINKTLPFALQSHSALIFSLCKVAQPPALITFVHPFANNTSLADPPRAPDWQYTCTGKLRLPFASTSSLASSVGSLCSSSRCAHSACPASHSN